MSRYTQPAWLLPLLAFSGLLLGLIWMAGFFEPKVAPATLESVTQDERMLHEVSVRSVGLLESVPGTFRAKQTTMISSRILARITEIAVRAGDTVSTGDILIRLEKADAKARLAQAQDRRRSLDARLTEAKLALDRAKALREKNLIAIADLDRAQSNFASLSAELSAAHESVSEAEVALQYSDIRAPIDGRIVDRFAEPGDTAVPGNTLMSIYNPLTLRVETPVREGLALNLTIGQILEVIIPALNRTVNARIDEIVPAADPGSRSFLVKARLEFEEVLKPGMYAEVQVPGELVERIFVPTAAFAQVGQLDVVWVQVDGTLQRRFVKVGDERPGDMIEVLSGLERGEKVLASPPVQ